MNIILIHQLVKIPGAAICWPTRLVTRVPDTPEANMPIFVPKDLWRWLIGPHTSPHMEYLHDHPGVKDATDATYAVPDTWYWWCLQMLILSVDFTPT